MKLFEIFQLIHNDKSEEDFIDQLNHNEFDIYDINRIEITKTNLNQEVCGICGTIDGMSEQVVAYIPYTGPTINPPCTDLHRTGNFYCDNCHSSDPPIVTLKRFAALTCDVGDDKIKQIVDIGAGLHDLYKIL